MPQFPLYIPSKGRADISYTSKALTTMGQEHYIVVEPAEVKEYKHYLKGSKAIILELDMSYQQQYDLLDDLGLEKSTGPGPARNFIWDHSEKNGHKWHWVMDDNIRNFLRLIKNHQIYCESSAFWTVMEDFCLRYTNIAMAGPNYYMFVPRKEKVPPFIRNTRIYSCNLIRNDVPFRWRGRYNEDTILSLDMLKAGWCTVLFNAFLQQKLTTKLVKGGNTQEFYCKEGTLKKSQMQVKIHPDISRLTHRFGRIHHHVNYKPFQKNRLRRRKDVEIKQSVNEYGMILKYKRPLAI